MKIICMNTGEEPVDGSCPTHGGDDCMKNACCVPYARAAELDAKRAARAEAAHDALADAITLLVRAAIEDPHCQLGPDAGKAFAALPKSLRKSKDWEALGWVFQ